MKITTERLKQIIKEEIEEAISGAAAGKDQQGPNRPEVAMTARWIKAVATYLKEAEKWEARTGLNHFTQYIAKLKTYLDGPRIGIRQNGELPVRPHGQNIPVDPTKWVEAPVQQELDEINKAHNLGHQIFLGVIEQLKAKEEGRPMPSLQAIVGNQSPKDAIHNEWQSVRYLGHTPGAFTPDARSGQPGTKTPDDERAYSRYVNENLQQLIDEELKTLLAEKEDDSFSQAGEEIEKKGTKGVFTAKAKKADMGVQEFARHVLANTDDFSAKTVDQASFAKGAATVARNKKKKKK